MASTMRSRTASPTTNSRCASEGGGTRLDAVEGALRLLAVGTMLVASHFADRSGHRKAFVWPFLMVGAVAFGGSCLLGVSSFWPAFVLLVIASGAMYAPYGRSSPGFETAAAHVAGGAIALINSCSALGSYAAVWLDARTGNPDASYRLMAASLLISGLMTLAVGADEVRGVATEEVGAVTAGLSTHPEIRCGA